VARRADALVSYNATVARLLARLAPGTPRHDIQNGVHPRFRPSAPGERERLRAALGWDERPRVLFAGRAVAKKGLALAQAAVRRAPGCVLVVAGHDELPAGTADDAELLGTLSPTRLADVYRACDALLLPAHGEGLPLVVLEALASGLPVVLRDDPGYGDVLRGAGPGLRLTLGDPAALGAALAAVVGDAALRRQAAERTAPWTAAAFSWPVAAERHEQLYAALLAERRRAASGPPNRLRR
jgi:glycosyltransferase involved in cell wall biosynthesis